MGVESLSEESETSEPWVNVSESLLDAPEVGVGLGCSLEAVREDPVLVNSVLHGTGLGRSRPGYFCIPAPLVSPQTSRRLVENSDGVLPHTVQHLLRSKLAGAKQREATGQVGSIKCPGT